MGPAKREGVWKLRKGDEVHNKVGKIKDAVRKRRLTLFIHVLNKEDLHTSLCKRRKQNEMAEDLKLGGITCLNGKSRTVVRSTLTTMAR